MTDFADWQSGVALVHAAVNQVGQTGHTLGPSGVTSLSPITMTQLALDISFSGSLPASSGTNPFAEMTIQWVDAASGQVTWIESVVFPSGNGVAIQCSASILAKGDQAKISIFNEDGAQTLTYSLAITQHSRPQARDRVYQPVIIGVFGFNQPGGNPEVGEQCNTSPSIAPNSSVTRLMPLSAGKHRVSVANLSGANPMSVAINDAFSGDLIAKWAIPAGSSDMREVNLPASPCQLTLANTAATNTITPNFTSMREDY